jgi:hypothetical protein
MKTKNRNYGRESQEHHLTDEQQLLGCSLNNVERSRAGNITHSAYQEIGAACKREFLRFIDQKITESAEQAKAEAEACLKILSPEE